MAACMVHACVCVCYDNMSCADQIHYVLVNDMLAVKILVTEHFDKTIETIRICRYFVLLPCHLRKFIGVCRN